MYEAPITEITKGIHTEIDNGIFKVVIESGIHIDKENLIKALKFDREQYDEGYKDGRKDAIKEFAERLKKRMGFCDLPNGIVRSHIDNLVNEMTE